MSPRGAAAAAAPIEDEDEFERSGTVAHFRGKYWLGPGGEPLPFPPPKAKGKLWEIKNGAIVARTHWGQTKAYTSKARIVAIIAGSQSGKTSFGPLWLEQEMSRCGPGDYLVVTPTVPLSRLKAIPEFLRLFESGLKLGRWLKGDRVFLIDPDKAARYFNNPAFNAPDADPTRVIFGTAANPESLESATAKAAWLDEVGQKQFRLEAWEAIQRRLVLHHGRVLMTTTPYSLSWLFQKIFKPWKEKTAKNIEVIQFPSNTNPAFPDAGMDEARENLPRWRYMLFYEGKFEKPEGLIYGVYEDAHWRFGGHMVHDFEIPDWWPVWVGVDFGGANTALVWIAMDPETGDYYLFHESLSGGKTTAQHAMENKAFASGRRVLGWYGGAAGESQQRRDWQAAGIPIQGPPLLRVEQPDGSYREIVLTDVELGINRVIAMLQRKHGRLYIFESVAGTRSQLGSYSRVLLPDGTPTDAIDDKNKFHYCFAPGTLVNTVAGPKPIEQIVRGDRVLTRIGYRRVLRAGRTASNTPVLRVQFSNGSTLVATPDHPVWVPGTGWVALDALRYGSLVACNRSERSSYSKASALSGAASNSGATLSRATGRLAHTSGSRSAAPAPAYPNTSTSPSGKMPTARSSAGGSFIMWTKIHSTMTRRIFVRCLSQTTFACTSVAARRSGKSSTLRKSVTSRLHGIPALQVEHGTSSMAGKPGWGAFLWIACAPNVVKRLVLSRTAPPTVSARIAAVPRGAAGAARTTKVVLARFAASPSWPTVTRRQRRARLRVARVLAIEDAGCSDVYNLSVDGAHEFFANGVLVHNCDALRYVAQHISGENMYLPDVLALGSTTGGWSNPLAYRAGTLPTAGDSRFLPLPVVANGGELPALPPPSEDALRPRVA